MKKCAKCGEICGDTSKFCSNCGASLADAEVVADDITGQVGEALEHALDQMIPPLEEESRLAKEKEAAEKEPDTETFSGKKTDDKADSKEAGTAAGQNVQISSASDGKTAQTADRKADLTDAAAAGLGMAAAAAAGTEARRRRPAAGASGQAAGNMQQAARDDAAGNMQQSARDDAARQAAQYAADAGQQQGRRPARPVRPQNGPGAAQQGAVNGRPRTAQRQTAPNGQMAQRQAASNGQMAQRQTAPNGQMAQGARSGQNPAGQQPIGTMVRRTQGGPAQGARPMMPVRPNPTAQTIRNAARGMLRSPLFVIYALAGFASIGLGIARQFLETVNLNDLVTVLKNFGASEQILGYANQGVSTAEQLGKFSVIPVILGNLPELLIVLGAFVLIATASKKKEEMPSAGFTMIKVGLIIQMVIACIVIFICLVAATALTVTAWISTDRVYFAIAVVILILAIVVSMMVIMYFFSLLHTRKVAMRNAVAGEDYSTASGYAAVICIIAAVLSVVGLLYEVVNNQTYGIAATGCSILVRLFQGIWILAYRGKMEKVIGE